MFDTLNKLLENINAQLKVCNDYLAKQDIKGFFVSLRVSAELVCKFLIVSEKKEIEFEHIFLKELAIKYKGREQYPSFYTMALFVKENKIVPNYIYYLLEFMRKSCNDPAHNVMTKDEEKYLLTPNKSSFNNLFYWFFNAYLKRDVPDDIKEFLNNYQFENSFSLFLMPFELNTSNFTFESFYNQLDESIWQPAGNTEMLNDFFLHKHIDTFLRSNNDCKQIDDIKQFTLISFTLRDNCKSKNSKLLKSLFLKNKHPVNEIDVKFNFFTKSELSPVLHFIPGLPVFFVSFGISIDSENNTLQKIIDFNYLLRAMEWNKVDFYTNKSLHPNAQENNVLIDEILEKKLNVHFKSKQQLTADNEFFTWNMNHFMDYLLIDFPDGSIVKIQPGNFHIFTFAQLKEQIPKDRLPILLTLISSVYNTNFYPTSDFISKNISFSQPFEQIYYASTNEGAVVLQNDDKEYNIPFFDDFESTIINRYLWVYKLVYFQKILLLNGIELLCAASTTNNQNMSHLLPSIYQILSLSDSGNVSNTSSVNHFYSVMRNGLGVVQLYNQLYQRWKT